MPRLMACLQEKRTYISGFAIAAYINRNIIGFWKHRVVPDKKRGMEKMQVNKNFQHRKLSSIILVSFLVLAVSLTVLPQTLALKPTSQSSITLTSPNPLPYVIYGVPGGMYGQTVAYGGNYIFVYGEGNFYVYNAQSKVLVKTLVGSTIAIGSGYVAIGDPSYTSTACKVNVYRLNNLNKIVATLSAPEEVHVGFGLAIAIKDDKMLISDVGSPIADIIASGDVYVYSLPSFSYITKLEQTNQQRAMGNPFGYSLAFCGKHIVVGAPDQMVNGAIFAGCVYIYNAKTYALEKIIPNPETNLQAAAWGQFGKSIAATDNKIWIAAPGYTYQATAEESEIQMAGKVYCYNSNGELLTTLNSPKPIFDGFFGRSIAVNDEYVIVGAPGEEAKVTQGDETTAIHLSGQVYIFSKSGTYLKTLTSPNPQSPGQFGTSVAFVKGSFLVGAPEEDRHSAVIDQRYKHTTKQVKPIY